MKSPRHGLVNRPDIPKTQNGQTLPPTSKQRPAPPAPPAPASEKSK